MRSDFLRMLAAYVKHPMRIVWHLRHRNNFAELRRRKAEIITR